MNAIRLTAAWVAAAMSGSMVAGDPAREFAGVSIDSRTVKAGDLFIAIRGERFDGAAFADAAVAAGAAGIVMSPPAAAITPLLGGHATAGGASVVVIAVADTTAAL